MIPNVATASAVATDAAAAEKIILTSGVDTNHFTGTGFVLVRGTVQVTPGTTTSAVVFKVYQGTTTGGTQVGVTLTRTLAATNTGEVTFMFKDAAPIAGGQYCASITQTAGAAAGTVGWAYLEAIPYPQG